MLSILKNSEQHGLQIQEQFINGSWINVVDPSPDEISQLEELGVEPDLIQYSLDLDEMARTERDEDYIFILIRAPIFNGTSADVPYSSVPLGIILKNNFVVTICRHDNDVVRVLCNGKYRGLRTAKRYRLALYILLETAVRYLAYLREINKSVDAVEDRLQASTRNKELLELFKYQKSLTYFATALRSNEVMMERIQRMQTFTQYEEDSDLLEDVLTENQQAIQMANISTEILAGMMDAFASVISNNLNVVMKALAALTIVLNIPTVVASFYGMNVALPFESHPLAFLGIIGFAVTLTALAIFIFYKRDWF